MEWEWGSMEWNGMCLGIGFCDVFLTNKRMEQVGASMNRMEQHGKFGTFRHTTGMEQK